MSTPQDPGSESEHRPRHAKPEPELPEVSDESEDSSAGQSEVTFSIFDDAPAPKSGADKAGRPEVSYSLLDDTPAEKSVHEPQEQGGRPGVDYGGLPIDTPESDAPKRQTWSTVGFVFAVVALLFFPIIFGVIGIGFGLYAHKKGETLGYWSAIAALTALLAGLAIRIFFFDATPIPE
ncbi:hypothetical protein ACFWUP_07275 [Nocardia sp. NPDC058658]|uniref:hypothetical protein n=1 Tax=Nocardia sp. NPDC058658 TaxID=3346580 RepID=UPI003647EB83